MDERELCRLLGKAERSADAISRLYDFYYPRIILHIRRTYPSVCAEDVAQEFFVNFLKAKTQRQISRPTAWVYACCENIAKAHLKKQIPSSDEEPAGESIEEAVLAHAEATRLLSTLDPRSQKVFYLYYWEGYTLSEIAEMLGLSKSAVKQIHARGLKKLKKEKKL